LLLPLELVLYYTTTQNYAIA